MQVIDQTQHRSLSEETGDEGERARYMGGAAFSDMTLRSDNLKHSWSVVPPSRERRLCPVPRSGNPTFIGRNWDMDPVVPKYGD